MLSWLAANAATIIISAVLLVIVIAIIRGMARGKLGCGGDCSACAGHGVSSVLSDDAACGSGCSVCRFGGGCRGS